MAEGPRDALVSRNYATYKTSHLKTRVPGLSCGIICRRRDRRTDRHTTTACTALSIESRSKNRPQAYCTAHQVELPGYERRLIANRQAHREMSVFTAYLNDNAETPLDRFVVYMLFKQVCNKRRWCCKIGQTVLDYRNFLIFKMVAVCHLGFRIF